MKREDVNTIVGNQFTQYEKRFFDGLNAEHQDIYSTFRRNIETTFLDFIAVYIRYFTSHGKKHSEGIIRQINYMLPDDFTLSSSEKLILLCTVWLHDIGLLVNKDPDEKLELSDADIRKKHHLLSRKIIIKYHKELGIEDPNIANLIAEIAYCHRRRDEKGNIEIENVFKERVFLGRDIIRPRLLAAVIRIGDALDTNWIKAPRIIPEEFSFFPEESHIHWLACRMVDAGYDHEKGAIYLTGTTNIEKPKFLRKESLLRDIFFWKYKEIREEFESVKNTLREHGLGYEKICYCLTNKTNLGETTTTCGESVEDDYKDVQIILCENEIEILNSRGMEIFVADVHYRIGLYYEEKTLSGGKKKAYIEKAANCYRDALINIDIAIDKKKNHAFQFFSFFYNFLRKFYELKHKQVLFMADQNASELTDGEKIFLCHAERIMRALDYIESQRVLVDSNDYLTTLLRAGRSPLRSGYKTAILSRIARIHEKGYVHKGCCLCTSKVVSQLTLIKELLDDDDYSIYTKSVDWLCCDSLKEAEWATIFKDDEGSELIRSGYVFTAQSLSAFMDIENEEKTQLCAALLIDNASQWYENMPSISDRNKGLGYIFTPLNRFIHEHKNLTLFDSKSIEAIYNDLVEGSKFNLPESMKLLPFLLVWKLNIGRLDLETVKNRAFEIIADNYSDVIWYKEGSWANDPKETIIRAANCLYFWEYVLSDKDARLDELQLISK